MFTLCCFDSVLPESLQNQVLQLVVDSLTDISPVSLPPSNALFALYQYVIGYEMHLYLQAMQGAENLGPRLCLALDSEDPSQILGFALALSAQDRSGHIFLHSVAVKACARHQGIGRAMVEKISTLGAQTDVACIADKVAYFEALGFQVLAARGPQVLLSNHTQASQADFAVQDLAPIFASKEVAQIHHYLLQRQGRKNMLDAEQKRDRTLDLLTHKAQLLAQQKRPTVH